MLIEEIITNHIKELSKATGVRMTVGPIKSRGKIFNAITSLVNCGIWKADVDMVIQGRGITVPFFFLTGNKRKKSAEKLSAFPTSGYSVFHIGDSFVAMSSMPRDPILFPRHEEIIHLHDGFREALVNMVL